MSPRKPAGCWDQEPALIEEAGYHSPICCFIGGELLVGLTLQELMSIL